MVRVSPGLIFLPFGAAQIQFRHSIIPRSLPMLGNRLKIGENADVTTHSPLISIVGKFFRKKLMHRLGKDSAESML
jgi:hypothetical protein